MEGLSNGYSRTDKGAPNAQVRFCPTCGSTTHFVLTDHAIEKFGNSLIGVNMWLANPGDLKGTELRFPDGRRWSGEGEFDYVRDPLVIA